MILDHLTDNQKYRLTSLPYRAGLFVSQSDQSGGEDASENELRALHNLIYGFADGMFGSELIQHIMGQTIKQKDKWPEWGQNLEQVPAECEDAISILEAFVDSRECAAYSMRIMDIGEAVALAFRENIASQAGFGRLGAYFRYLSMKRKAKAKKKPICSFEDFLSISPDERRALGAMASAFRTEYI